LEEVCGVCDEVHGVCDSDASAESAGAPSGRRQRKEDFREEEVNRNRPQAWGKHETKSRSFLQIISQRKRIPTPEAIKIGGCSLTIPLGRWNGDELGMGFVTS